jgi:hypothetical protein
MSKQVLGSLARIADFDSRSFDVQAIPRAEWETGDYVLGEVIGEPTRLYTVECTTGEMIGVDRGDQVIGAFGHRAATLEGVGSWIEIDSGEMNAMTSAGLFGRFTSVSKLLPRPMDLEYTGHIVRGGRKVRMRDYALEAAPCDLDIPTILMVGTSMSAGKTMVGKFACQILSDLGFRVIGIKLTGAGRYRDSTRNPAVAELHREPRGGFHGRGGRGLAARTLQWRGGHGGARHQRALLHPLRHGSVRGRWRTESLRAATRPGRRSGDQYYGGARPRREADRLAGNQHHRP